MIKFTSIASSSAGNAYLVEAPGVSPLLVEAGLPIRALREKLNFGLAGLAGCLVSHEHGDHSKSVKHLLKAGVDCYMSRGTAEALGNDIATHHRMNIIQPGTYKIGAWTVLSFPLEHDAREPLGFVIANGDDKLLFIPDTGYVHNRFTGITQIAVEANHVGEILINNVIDGNLPAIVARRIRRSHMSLEQVISLLKANDLSKVRRIFLLHLSSGNSDEKRMVLEVQSQTGIPTEACA